MKGKTHFSSSARRKFPQHLLYHRYEVDGGALRPDPGHTMGRKVEHIVELQRWSGIDNVSDLFRNAGIVLKGIDVSGLRDVSADALCALFAELRSSLEKVNMSRCFADEQLITASLCGLTHLTYLNAADNPLLITDEAVELLSETLRHLAFLDISGCTFLSDKSLLSIARHGGTTLRSLTSRRNNLITDTVANHILTHCEQIECIDFSFCANLKLMGVFERKNKASLYSSRSLQTVTLDGCPNLAIESFDWLCSSNSKLTTVSFSDASSLSEGSLLGLLFSCPELTLLHLSGCTSVSAKVMKAITQKCRNLSDLDLSRAGIGISSFDANELFLGSAFSRLERLDLSGNTMLGDDIVPESVSSGISPATASDKLAWLNMAHCSFTGLGIARLARRCRFLRHLDISGLPLLTDAAVRTVVASCTQLRELWMDDCPLVGDSSVVAIAYGLPKLLSLHLSSSVDLTHDSAGDPIRHCQFSDDAVEALLDGARRLEDLTLRNQNGVCLVSPWFSKGFPRRAGHFSLQRLDLSGVDLLSARGAVMVLSHCTNISEVLLSQRLPHAFRTKKFWDSCFSKAVYAASYEEIVQRRNALTAQFRLLEAEFVQFPGERESGKMLRAQTRGLDSPKAGSPVVRSRSLSFFNKNSIASIPSASSPMRGEGSNDYSPNSPSRSAVNHLKKQKREMKPTVSTDPGEAGDARLSTTLSTSLSFSTAKGAEKKPNRRQSAQEQIVASKIRKERNLNTPHCILRPIAQAAALRFRDMYVRRRLTERHSARIIRQAWKVHIFWVRVGKRLSSRKIANWFKKILDERMRMKLKKILYLSGRAKTLQRLGRRFLRVRYLSAICIQRISRGGRARTNLKLLNNRVRAATVIQTWTRGWLSRLTDRSLLTQLYLLLPPFWRTILHSAPYEPDVVNPIANSIEAMRRMLEDKKEPTVASLSAKSDQIIASQIRDTRAVWVVDEEVSLDKIRELKRDVTAMSLRSSELLPTDSEMVRRGGGRARLPFLVPQSFDQASYYTLDDGKHIPIAGMRNILTNTTQLPPHRLGESDKAATGRIPIHSFDIKLWPISGSAADYEKKSILLFNPNNDNIKSGMAGPREAILCEHCSRHLRLLYCATCKQGLCFVCMFRVHSLHSKRGHKVALLEPRVTLQAPQENTDSCRSLVYYVDLAKHSSHLIGCVLYLKTVRIHF